MLNAIMNDFSSHMLDAGHECQCFILKILYISKKIVFKMCTETYSYVLIHKIRIKLDPDLANPNFNVVLFKNRILTEVSG